MFNKNAVSTEEENAWNAMEYDYMSMDFDPFRESFVCLLNRTYMNVHLVAPTVFNKCDKQRKPATDDLDHTLVLQLSHTHP